MLQDRGPWRWLPAWRGYHLPGASVAVVAERMEVLRHAAAVTQAEVIDLDAGHVAHAVAGVQGIGFRRVLAQLQRLAVLERAGISLPSRLPMGYTFRGDR